LAFFVCISINPSLFRCVISAYYLIIFRCVPLTTHLCASMVYLTRTELRTQTQSAWVAVSDEAKESESCSFKWPTFWSLAKAERRQLEKDEGSPQRNQMEELCYTKRKASGWDEPTTRWNKGQQTTAEHEGLPKAFGFAAWVWVSECQDNVSVQMKEQWVEAPLQGLCGEFGSRSVFCPKRARSFKPGLRTILPSFYQGLFKAKISQIFLKQNTKYSWLSRTLELEC